MYMTYLINNLTYPYGGYFSQGCGLDIVGEDENGMKHPSECHQFFPLSKICPW